MISGFENLTVNETIKKLRKLRNLSQQELADMLKIPLDSYIKLECNEKVRTQLILDIAPILNVCPQFICFRECAQKNTLCLNSHDYKCPRAFFSKLELVEYLTLEESNFILKLRHLNQEEQKALFNITDILYLKNS